MIDRYSRPEMAAIWTEDAKLQRWLDVELAVCRAWARRGVVPLEDLALIEARAAFSVERTQEIERTTNHDVVAFLTNVAEHIGPASRWVHYGMTSSDVLDTGLALAVRQAGDILLREQAALTEALRRRAVEHAATLCVGRTHGIHAEPTTFGLKLAGFAVESRRNEERIARAVAGASVGKLSGAVGTYAMLAPDLEAEVMDELGISAEPFATQVVARDRHAELVAALAVAASSLDRLATELRHLQRTELREAEEAFRAGQKGSSAMPHKRNPITAERISGLARVIRGHSVAALENVALWHERDISHSSVERVILPDATILLDYLLATTRRLVEGLVVSPERMLAVLDSSHGLVFSQRILLGLVERGLTREDAYALVQRNAMRAWDEGRPLRELLADDADVTRVLDPDDIDELMDPAWYLRHADTAMARLTPLERPTDDVAPAPPPRRSPELDHPLRDAILAALHTAREPVRESALYERICARVSHPPTPQHFVDTLSHLAVEQHVAIAPDHEPPRTPDPAPFQPRYYRLIRD
jgi:adenylosuccinate lyase